MKNKNTGNILKRRIYLINPRNPDNFWTMQSSVDAVGVKTLMPNSALATLVSLTPKDINIEYLYCDENISKINFEIDCDLVAITGYTLHAERIHEISTAFRKRNILVAIGGIYATLYPESAKKYADYLFVKEAEVTWPQFLKEWSEGKACSYYEQKEFIDMKLTPPPDWSFVKGKDYLYFAVQTSRGCPNNCDFCDAIRIVGRKYRTKPIDQILIEIKNAHAAGAETVFFSEDNFFVNRKFTIQLLKEIINWNTSIRKPLSFSAQATVMIGHDEEVLKLMADAKFSVVFLGVESLRKECLQEINKGQMTVYDPKICVKKLSKYGILPFIGLIVGFDNDDKFTFSELEAFLDETHSPIASISVLNAPEDTKLYNRMKEQGRINENFKGVWHFSTNIVPKSMTIEELLRGHRSLWKGLYDPENFEKRALNWLFHIEYFSPLYNNKKINYSKLMKFIYIMKYYLLHEPKPVRLLFFRILRKTWKNNPQLIKKAVTVMSQYCHYYNFANNALWNKIEGGKKECL